MHNQSIHNSKIELVTCLHTPGRSQTYDFIESQHMPSCKCKSEKTHSSCSPQCKSKNHGCVRSHYWSHLTGILNEQLSVYYTLSTHSSNSNQIELDLTRTFPENSYFSSDLGAEVLNRALNKFANLMPNPGYVQGMNYIMAALLWHCSEIQAFWIFVKLITDYNLRENFIDGLPGLLMHFDVVENYIRTLWPAFLDHLQNNSIMVGMFVTDWCITIFTNVIPIDKVSRFFSCFLEEGWAFFYKLTLEILDRLKKKCLKVDDRLEILSILKPFQLYADPHSRFLESLTQGFERKNWSTIIKSAKKRKLS